MKKITEIFALLYDIEILIEGAIEYTKDLPPSIRAIEKHKPLYRGFGTPEVQFSIAFRDGLNRDELIRFCRKNCYSVRGKELIGTFIYHKFLKEQIFEELFLIRHDYVLTTVSVIGKDPEEFRKEIMLVAELIEKYVDWKTTAP